MRKKKKKKALFMKSNIRHGKWCHIGSSKLNTKSKPCSRKIIIGPYKEWQAESISMSMCAIFITCPHRVGSRALELSLTLMKWGMKA